MLSGVWENGTHRNVEANKSQSRRHSEKVFMVKAIIETSCTTLHGLSNLWRINEQPARAPPHLVPPNLLESCSGKYGA